MTKLTLPPLPYGYGALEPWIDEQTMRVHHDKHHQAYLDNLVKAITGTEFENVPPEKLLANLGQLPEKIRAAVRNHGGGYVNHNLFWEVMAPQAGGVPAGELAKGIGKEFGSFDAFKEKFAAAAAGQFGSGWAWLVVKRDGTLAVYSLPNQDNPVSGGDNAVLGLDVWEHAYYLKYQNRRAEYIGNWWNLVNWAKVGELYEHART
jgi:Fe-Mn family superoxide dismutase